MLSALDHNNNANRSQKTTIKKKGKKLRLKRHYKIAFRKPTKKLIARKVYEPKKYDYLREILEECRRSVAIGNRNKSTPVKKRMAPSERDDRNKIIRMSIERSRFKK